MNAYKIAFHLSNYVWGIVFEWKNFERRTVREQFVTAIDSISANIAEGFGRYSKKDKMKFYRYAFGSLKESLHWNEKAGKRKLITGEQHAKIFKELNVLSKEINALIKLTNIKLTI